MKKGFTLIEMLLVIGIIAVLAGSILAGLSHMTKSSERQRCQELVANVSTALTQLFNDKGVWPRAMLANGLHGGLLDETATIPLALGGYLSLSYDNQTGKLIGYDKFGVITPWAAAFLKSSNGAKATLSTAVPTGGKIQDHILHFAVDADGDGVIPNVSIGGQTISVRATVAVWCGGKDGVIEPYSKGLKGDDVYSWSYGQTQHVK